MRKKPRDKVANGTLIPSDSEIEYSRTRKSLLSDEQETQTFCGEPVKKGPK